MAEFLLELFSEEIPARMQARGVAELARLVGEALAALGPAELRLFHGPRRIAIAATVAGEVAAQASSERGPRVGAPEQALDGFLRKHQAERSALREAAGFWVLERETAAMSAAGLIAASMPGVLRRMSWPKSMRWGGSSGFTWVRPLRRILCLLDGAVVAFDLREGADDGHGLVAGDLTEGHRFLSPGAFAVTSVADWAEKLRARHVVVDAAERRRLVAEGVARLAGDQGAVVVDDPGLLDEVAGLVEWPVPLLGRIDAAHMDLPAEVMQVSMRVNQRYFSLRDAQGRAAPYFAFAANIAAPDGGATIVAGNERVLRARFSDARYFWDLDRTRRLESRVAALDDVTFHARLGSQGDRVRRMAAIAAVLAGRLDADVRHVGRAVMLAKADLGTGMVGEFPELQGVMGRYYALHDGEAAPVADAIRDHYAPKGPGDAVPGDPVSIVVALADKLDLLAGFFGIGEKPSGSGDPYALRRAALGIIRIIRENGLRLPLRAAIAAAVQAQAMPADGEDILGFLAERLRVQLRAEGARHDVLAAVMGGGIDDDFTRLLARSEQVAGFLATAEGTNLLAAAKRAANILRIEEKKDGPHGGAVDPALFAGAEEAALGALISATEPRVVEALAAEDFAAAMSALAVLRPCLDAFFKDVTVNDPQPDLRRNRLALLSRVRRVMDRVADFSRVEG